MRPQESDRSAVSSGVTSEYKFGISAKGTAHLVRLLRDSIYSDKIVAVLREYSTNAWDAHVAAGIPDRPIKVTLPTVFESSLIIRDYGRGLSEEDIRSIYTQYGESTKRDNDSELGMFGIGAKSGFAYNDTFTVTSYHKGRKLIFNMVLDESDIGVAQKLWEGACSPEETGVEIKVPVLPGDAAAFEERARRLFTHFCPRPDINVELGELKKIEIAGVGYVLPKSLNGSLRDMSGWFAIVGCVPYRIDLSQLGKELGHLNLSRFSQTMSGGLYIPVGGVQITGSRESLEYKTHTKNTLVSRFAELSEELSKEVEHRFENHANKWELRKFARGFHNEYSLPIPERFRKYGDATACLYSPVAVAPSKERPPKHFRLGAMYRVEGRNRFDIRNEGFIETVPGSFLLIINTKKPLRGYSINGWPLDQYKFGWGTPGVCHLVRSTSDDPTPEMFQELEERLIEAELDGIPIYKTSELTYTPPSVKGGSVKHRRSAFVLKRDSTKPGSGEWDVVDEVPDDCVYVVLDRFVPVHKFSGMYRFSEVVRKMEETFRLSGGSIFPDIYGFKTTEKNPLDESKISGTSFHVWLLKQLEDLLDDGGTFIDEYEAYAGVAYFAKTFGSSAAYDNEPLLDDDRLNKFLDGGHLICNFSRNVSAAQQVFKRVKVEQRELMNQLKKLIHQVEEMCFTGEELRAYRRKNHRGLEQQLQRIYERYPLLDVEIGGPGIQILKGGSEKWFEYIKMVDAAQAQDAIKEAE